MTYAVTAFYKFIPILEARLEPLSLEIESFAKSLNLEGLFLIGTEGVNSTMSGDQKSLEAFKKFLREHPELRVEEFKDSASHKAPFRKLRIRIKPEIVTIGEPGLVPAGKNSKHLSPQEWHRTLQEESDILILDTRNDYEVKMGKFVGKAGDAVDVNIVNFSDFPKKVEEAGWDKDKKVLMYCTGGIRCEKASLAMQNMGFKNVFQLDGGILKYIEEFPEQNFKGDCFVFDSRIAVNQKLEPVTDYGLCPHCGQPGQEVISCVRCDTKAKICEACQKQPEFNTCSKNCCYHVRLKPGRKGRHQVTRGVLPQETTKG